MSNARIPLVLALAFTVACENVVTQAPPVDTEATNDGIAGLTFDERRAVASVIRDVARAKGITNAVVLAGVAQQETNLVHCFADAPFHCAGPSSSSCGGAALAGSGDGPCNIRQGGLGMYQLDSGTHSQTIAQHGARVLELDGNIDIGIDFILHKVEICQNTPVFNSRDESIAWVNGAVPGTVAFEEFHRAMTSCYNGCSVAVCGRAVHDQRFAQYRDSTWRMLDEMGHDFWFAQPEPEPQPDPQPDPQPEPEPIDPSTMSCGEYSIAAGYDDGACEWNGNGACGARGPATNDCEHCCDWSTLPFDPVSGEMTSEMSCGEYADHVQFTNAQCEWNDNGACDGVGARTWDCEACCDRP